MRTFEEGDGDAWEAARAEVDAGNPALLLTDLYYLDHYGNSAHFPGHAVVLAGYDEEVAHLSDTGFEELQTTRLENLDKARHSSHPAYPLAGHMFTVSGAVDPEQLRDARSRRRSSAPPRRCSSRASASSPASPPSTASPPRPAPGPRSPRTGSGAPASATR